MCNVVYSMRLFKLYATVILLFSFNSAFAQQSCRDLFRDTLVIEKKTELVDRKSSTVKDFTSLKPSDLLTPEFINNLEQGIGPVQISFSHESSNLKEQLAGKIFKTETSPQDMKSLSVKITAGKEDVVHFTVYFEKKSEYVAIDGLEVSNPMDKQIENLHMSQSSKGVPMTEFNKAKTMIVSLIKKQGWHGILCRGTTHYLVSMLYQRFIDMRPTQSASKYYSYLDSIRKNFSSSKVFYEALGSIRPDMLMVGIEQAWATVKNQEDMVEKGFSAIYKDDQIVAVTYSGRLSHNEPRTYIIDPFDAGKSFMHWSRMMSLGQTELVLNF